MNDQEDSHPINLTSHRDDVLVGGVTRPRRDPATTAEEPTPHSSSSMTWALFVSWIVPCLVFAVVSRYTVHLEPDPDILVRNHKPRPVKLPLDHHHHPNTPSALQPTKEKKKKKRKKDPSRTPSLWPTNYHRLVETIDQRRRRVGTFRTSPSEARVSSAGAAASQRTATDPDNDTVNSKKIRGTASDPERSNYQTKISHLRTIHQADPTNVFKAIHLADAYRMYELQFHDGGLYEDEAIATYQVVVDLAEMRRQDALDQGRPTNVGPTGQPVAASIHDELVLDYTDKSPDGLLCAVYTARGKVYYMANMFAKAVQSYTRCLTIEPFYLDALDARASAYIILGQYEEAARDYLQVIERDQNRLLFPQSYTGLARVLEARENVTQDGWGSIIGILDSVIPTLEIQLDTYPQMKQALAPTLNRLHHVVCMNHCRTFRMCLFFCRELKVDLPLVLRCSRTTTSRPKTTPKPFDISRKRFDIKCLSYLPGAKALKRKRWHKRDKSSRKGFGRLAWGTPPASPFSSLDLSAVDRRCWNGCWMRILGLLALVRTRSSTVGSTTFATRLSK